MTYEALERNLATFNEITSKLQLKIDQGSEIKGNIDTVREFLGDRKRLPELELMAKWNPRNDEYHDSRLVVSRLTEATILLKDQTSLKSRLKQVLCGSLLQNGKPETAKDIFYELEMAAYWKRCGFTVELAEPDIVVSGNGLAHPLGVACKYPSGFGSFQEHISKGYAQIQRHGHQGLIAIGLDQFALKKMEGSIGFRNAEVDTLNRMRRKTEDFMKAMVEWRANGYPSERPIDGAMVTLSIHGICFTTAQLTHMQVATLLCADDNPRYTDMVAFYRGMLPDSTAIP